MKSETSVFSTYLTSIKFNEITKKIHINQNVPIITVSQLKVDIRPNTDFLLEL